MPAVDIGGDTYKLRWARAEELPALVQLDRRCGREDLFIPEGLLGRVQARSVMVLAQDDCYSLPGAAPRLVAMLVFIPRPGDNRLLFVGTDPDFRNRGLAARLVEALQKLSGCQARNILSALVRESELQNQLFLKAIGFRCLKIFPDLYDYPPEAAYAFVRDLAQPDLQFVH